ncbi:MAG TPA: hypothetical protein H9977_02345, partial [Candidatus Parabacteroides intestinipullorum]|nr:hypothetical protein [Candidatus Parabacteroides intestinipullorum]
MNKKFSTLMAGLMLASAFSVNAADEVASLKYENGKYYLLGNGTNYISVNSEAGEDFGKLTWEKMPADQLLETREALWKVTVTPGNVGDAPKFVFQNVATGLYLNIAGKSDEPVIAGSYQEWYNGVSTTFTEGYDGAALMSYINANKVVYLALDDDTEPTLIAKEGTPSDGQEQGVKIQPYYANIVKNLTADELNKELLAKATVDVFNLTFNKDVTEGAENLFSKTALVATQMYTDNNGVTDATETTGDSKKYVRLHVKDTKNYIVVDTTLHTGSEAERQLPKFAYDDPNKASVDYNNVNRLQESFNFAFSYLPFEDRILIQSEGYYTRAYNKKTGAWAVGTVDGTDSGDGNTAYTGWNTSAKFPSNIEDDIVSSEKIEDAYVRLVELSSVRELTVASENEEDVVNPNDASGNKYNEWEGYDDLSIGMNTTVTLGQGLLTYQPTTIEEGLYMIKFASNARRSNATEGDYFISNLGGYYGFSEQAKNQNYDHMPAAHWYVKQNGNTNTAPISITNREFNDGDTWNEDGTAKNYFGLNNYFQAFKTDDNKVFFVSGVFTETGARDTLEFIPVSDASKADKYLGYKHVDEAQASVEIYNFNYLHGLSLDNGLNTPLTDSLVRVDETGEKAAFRLIPVVESDSYGIQLDEKKTGIANLVRNVYYVQAYDNSKFEGTRYLNYDEASKKYVMSTTKQPFFLKENNDVDGTHYYALVEANLFVPYAYKVGRTDWESNLESILSTYTTPIFPADLAGVEVKNLSGDVNNYSYNYRYQSLKNNTQAGAYDCIAVPFYDEVGQPIVTDNSTVALYAYQIEDGKIVLKRFGQKKQGETATRYAYMNMTVDKGWDFTNGYRQYSNGTFISKLMSGNYASARISVDDNTLDLTQAGIEDKWMEEIRVSAFDAKVIDSPLYRRFNGAAPETYGDAANAPLNLKFFRYNNPAEYLFENYSSENKYRDGINDKSISF